MQTKLQTNLLLITTANMVVENAVVENANTIPQENVDAQTQTNSPAQVTSTDSNNQN